MIRVSKTLVAFGDVHLPYEDKDAVNFAMAYVALKKPTFVVQIGDIYDFFNFSKYSKSLSGLNAEEEVTKARGRFEEFWDAVKKASPRSKLIQIKGNHCDRPMKRLLEKAPELEVFTDLKSVFEYPGVETIHDSKEEVELDVGNERVLLHHGHRSKLGDHMLYNSQSTVVGHSHVGGVVYTEYRKRTLWELNVGYLADKNKGPLKYGNQNKRKWTLGIGEVDQYGPRFIPYP